MKGREGRAAAALAAPALSLLAVFLLVPLAMAAVNSLFVDTPFSPRRFVGLRHYRALFEDAQALGTLGFTFLFVGVSALLETAAGLCLALVLHAPFRGRGTVRAAALLPWAIPTVVAGAVWRHLANDQSGGLNLLFFGGSVGDYRAWLAEPFAARAAVIAADVWKTSGFAALVILAGLSAVPGETLEAARVDGAGPWRRLLHVTLPLLRPALALAFLFRVMDAFRVFDLIYVMTQGGPADATNVLSFYGYQKMFPEQRFGYGSMVSVVVFALTAFACAAAARWAVGRAREAA